MFASRYLKARYWQARFWSAVAVIAPQDIGLEYELFDGRNHFGVDGRDHYILAANRPHYLFGSDN